MGVVVCVCVRTPLCVCVCVCVCILTSVLFHQCTSVKCLQVCLLSILLSTVWVTATIVCLPPLAVLTLWTCSVRSNPPGPGGSVWQTAKLQHAGPVVLSVGLRHRHRSTRDGFTAPGPDHVAQQVGELQQRWGKAVCLLTDRSRW